MLDTPKAHKIEDIYVDDADWTHAFGLPMHGWAPDFLSSTL